MKEIFGIKLNDDEEIFDDEEALKEFEEEFENGKGDDEDE